MLLLEGLGIELICHAGPCLPAGAKKPNVLQLAKNELKREGLEYELCFLVKFGLFSERLG